MSSQNAISILHGLRNLHEHKKKHGLFSFLFCLGILIFEIMILIIVKAEGLSLFGWFSIWLLILCIGFSLQQYLENDSWINAIDGFYLEKTYSKKSDNIKNYRNKAK